MAGPQGQAGEKLDPCPAEHRGPHHHSGPERAPPGPSLEQIARRVPGGGAGPCDGAAGLAGSTCAAHRAGREAARALVRAEWSEHASRKAETTKCPSEQPARAAPCALLSEAAAGAFFFFVVVGTCCASAVIVVFLLAFDQQHSRCQCSLLAVERVHRSSAGGEGQEAAANVVGRSAEAVCHRGCARLPFSGSLRSPS